MIKVAFLINILRDTINIIIYKEFDGLMGPSHSLH